MFNDKKGMIMKEKELTQEQRRAAFKRRVAAGKRHNDAAKKSADWFEQKIKAGQMTLREALMLSYGNGLIDGRNGMVYIGDTQIRWGNIDGRAFPEADESLNDIMMPSTISLNFEDEDKVEVYFKKIKEDKQ